MEGYRVGYCKIWCVWSGMAWYGMVWYGMVWYGMVWYGMVWYGMVWYGMVWYAMVCYGMVCHGMLWYVRVKYRGGIYGVYSLRGRAASEGCIRHKSRLSKYLTNLFYF